MIFLAWPEKPCVLTSFRSNSKKAGSQVATLSSRTTMYSRLPSNFNQRHVLLNCSLMPLSVLWFPLVSLVDTKGYIALNMLASMNGSISPFCFLFDAVEVRQEIIRDWVFLCITPEVAWMAPRYCVMCSGMSSFSSATTTFANLQ